MEQWYVAKTKPCKELWVQTYLTEQVGIDVFLPLIRRPASRKASWEPLFPTYMFCLVDPESTAWSDVRWAPGVSYFLGNGQQIAPVTNELVDHLKQRVSWWNGGGFVPRFSAGEHVVVTSGPFTGIEGIFQRYIPARQRCQVLLNIVGQLSKVEVPVETIKSGPSYQGLALAGCPNTSA